MPSKCKSPRLEQSSKILTWVLVSSLSFFKFSIPLLNVSLIWSIEFYVCLSLNSVIFLQVSTLSFTSSVFFIILFNRLLLSLISIVNLSRDVWSSVAFWETIFTNAFFFFLKHFLKKLFRWSIVKRPLLIDKSSVLSSLIVKDEFLTAEGLFMNLFSLVSVNNLSFNWFLLNDCNPLILKCGCCSHSVASSYFWV